MICIAWCSSACRLKARLFRTGLTALEEPLDALNEERAEGEVEGLLFALITEDQNVAGLDQRSSSGAVDGSRQINRDGDLVAAGRFTQDIEHAGRSAADALRRNAAQTAAAAAKTSRAADAGSRNGQSTENVEVIVARQWPLAPPHQAARIENFPLAAFDKQDVTFIEDDVLW